MGVWNGWGYGIAIFQALNLQKSQPEIWPQSRFNCRVSSGTEKVPQRTWATKILPNFRVNFRLLFASKTLVLLGSALELFRKFFGAVRANFWLWGSFWSLISGVLEQISASERHSDSGKWPFHTPLSAAEVHKGQNVPHFLGKN